MADWYSGADHELYIQILKPDGVNPQNLGDSDVLQYGVILFEADGTIIGQYSSNGTTLAGSWQASSKIEIYDEENGIVLIHVDKELTQGVASQMVTARTMVQRDASLDGDDKHTDNEHFEVREFELQEIIGSLNDSIITMT